MIDEQDRKAKKRRNEKGAALVMVLLIGFLLLVASAALLLEASMNTSNVTDATAEQQAYYAAESGIQSALNVLRGNTSPLQPIASVNHSSESADSGLLSYLNPLRLIETSASAQTSPTPNQSIDFRRAVTLSTSNKSDDTSAFARMSRWLQYDSTYTDRVIIGNRTNYQPERGMAFGIEVVDPDNTGTLISYNTTGSCIINSTGTCVPAGTPFSVLDGNGNPNAATITYNSASVSNLNVSSGSAVTNLGSFTLVKGTGNANKGVLSTKLRFIIKLNMTKPFTATKEIRGWILPGEINQNSTTINLLYDSQVHNLMGSYTTLQCPTGVAAANCRFISDTTVVPPLLGYRVLPNAPNSNNGVTPVSTTMTPTELLRLTIRSTGYGPRGAKKVLETIVQKNAFNGMSAPATLTLVGGSANFDFNPGTSAVTSYSGDDMATNLYIPPIGTTNAANLAFVQDSVDGKPPHPFNGAIVGTPANITSELPTWLQSPANLHDTIQSLKFVAESSGRYFPSGTAPNGFGNVSTARGITFADGNTSLTGSGGGILVCTGTLTLDGEFNFRGLIIVTGPGGVIRNGGGGGSIEGNLVIAPYNQSSPGQNLADFLTPVYDLSGGGNSTIVYNSSNVTDGMIAVSNFVRGVAEK